MKVIVYDVTMAEPAYSSTKDKPRWINGEHTEVKPAGETEDKLKQSLDELKPAKETVDELKPVEESVHKLKSAQVSVDELNELSELSDTALGAGKELIKSDTEPGAGKELIESDTDPGADMDLAGQVIFGPKKKMDQACFFQHKRNSKPMLRIHYHLLIDPPRNSNLRKLFWIKWPKKKCCSPRRDHNRFIMGLFHPKFDQALYQSISNPFSSRNTRKRSHGRDHPRAIQRKT